MRIEDKTDTIGEDGLGRTRIVTTPAGTTLGIPEEVTYNPKDMPTRKGNSDKIHPYQVPRRIDGEYKI